MSTSPLVPFGRDFKKKYFTNFDPTLLPLNHASYGAQPVPVLEAEAKEHAEYRSNPDWYLHYVAAERLETARNELAQVLDADPRNIGFAHNGTTASNILLRSYPFQKGDYLIAASTTFGYCANTIKFLEEYIGIVPVFVPINYPMGSDEIVEAYAKAIKKSSAKGTVRMAFFDTVSSKPAARLPWERLVALCKDEGILSFVDGAHCIGLLENVSLNTVRPDFFVTNIHKWFYSPTSASLIYADKKHHRAIQSFPVSSGYVPQDAVLTAEEEDNLFKRKFTITGTGEYTNFIAATAAAHFRRDVCGGESNIIRYTYDLALKASALFVKELGGEPLVGGGPEDPLKIETSMVNVYVPFDKYGIPKEDYGKAMKAIQDYMARDSNVFIPLFIYNGRPAVRLAAQVYLELADFELGVQALKAAILKYIPTATFA